MQSLSRRQNRHSSRAGVVSGSIASKLRVEESRGGMVLAVGGGGGGGGGYVLFSTPSYAWHLLTREVQPLNGNGVGPLADSTVCPDETLRERMNPDNTMKSWLTALISDRGIWSQARTMKPSQQNSMAFCLEFLAFLESVLDVGTLKLRVNMWYYYCSVCY